MARVSILFGLIVLTSAAGIAPPTANDMAVCEVQAARELGPTTGGLQMQVPPDARFLDYACVCEYSLEFGLD